MTEEQLEKISKYVNKFLGYETSTMRGIKDIRKRTIESLRKHYSTPKLTISYSEAETLYELLNSNDYDWVFEYMTPSEFWDTVEEAISRNWTEEKWVEELMIHYIHKGNDVEMITKVQALYRNVVMQMKAERQ